MHYIKQITPPPPPDFYGLRGVFRIFAALLICSLFIACGGGGSNNTGHPTPTPPSGTTPTPATPAPQPVDCSRGAVAQNGAHFQDKAGGPACFAHLLAAVNDRQVNNTIPSNARGVAIIYDDIYSDESQGRDFRFLQEYYRRNPQDFQKDIREGADGKGNFFTISIDPADLDGNSHFEEVWRTYAAFSPVQPSALITFKLAGTSSNIHFEFIEQMAAAYTAGHANNPLVRHHQEYSAPKAIINLSLAHANLLFYELAARIQNDSSDFPNIYDFTSIAEGLIGVGALGNSNATWWQGFHKESDALVWWPSLYDKTIPAELGAVVDRVQGQVEINTILTDLLSSTSTDTLTELVKHGFWRTPASKITTAFPNANATQRNLLANAANVRIKNHFGETRISLLDMMAGGIVHARNGHFYTAAYLNATGDATQQNTPCGVLCDSCFILPYYEIAARQARHQFRRSATDRYAGYSVARVGRVSARLRY